MKTKFCILIYVSFLFLFLSCNDVKDKKEIVHILDNKEYELAFTMFLIYFILHISPPTF